MKPETNEATGHNFWTHEKLSGVVQCSNRECELTPVWSDRYRAWVDVDRPESTPSEVEDFMVRFRAGLGKLPPLGSPVDVPLILPAEQDQQLSLFE